MPSTKEIRGKIKSVQNTRKITKAMEMVAASKMRKAQERMRQIRAVRRQDSQHRRASVAGKPRVQASVRAQARGQEGGGRDPDHDRQGLVRRTEHQHSTRGAGEGEGTSAQDVQVLATAIGNKGFGFLQRLNANIVSHYVQMGDRPHIEKLIGPVKVLLDQYADGKLDAVYLAYTRFVNTMKQEPVIEQLLPLTADRLAQTEEEKRAYSWDYIYEPDPRAVIDTLMVRYVEALIYQSVAENMASEQSARMVAMKAASDNAKKLIEELQLVYNKTRQAGITKEISEIVGGAAAVAKQIAGSLLDRRQEIP